MARPKAPDLPELAVRAEAEIRKTRNQAIQRKLAAIIEAATKPQKEVASSAHVSRQTLHAWIKTFREGGVAALGEKPRKKRQERLDPVEADVLRWVDNRVDRNGNDMQWTLERLSLAVFECFGIKISGSYIGMWLHARGRAMRTPRAKHRDAASPEEQRQWKLKLSERVAKWKAEKAERKKSGRFPVWFMDECRAGTFTVVGRQWARKGVPLTVRVRQGRKNFYVYGAVNPVSGETFFLFIGGVSTDLMNLYLKELSEFLGDREIILVMDNAGWHRSKALVVPWNITLHYLPPYTPEPGPVERVWRILKRDCLRKRYYEDVDEIMDVFQEWFRARSRRSYRALCHCDHLVNSIL